MAAPSRRPATIVRRLLTPLLLMVAALAVAAGCGNDGTSDDASKSSGRPTDRAFVNNMIPHHEGAIAMAELAPRRAQRPEIRRLARNIRSSQEGEITTLRSVQADLKEAGGGAVADIGSGADHQTTSEDLTMLREADDFDRMFIEMMIPHHESAIDMATVELRNGQDDRLRKIATEIIAAQKREIGEMKGWSKAWYGQEPQEESSAQHHG